MNKAFTRETDTEDDGNDDVEMPALSAGARKYIAVAGYRCLRGELFSLLDCLNPKSCHIGFLMSSETSASNQVPLNRPWTTVG
jgi:transcription elongation factor GreB